MAESGLTLDLAAFRVAVAEYKYGGDADYALLTLSEQAAVDRIINAGLRQAYKPPPVQGKVHSWSFLQPVSVLELNAAYSTGTVEVIAGVVTLTGGIFPAWAADGEIMLGGADYQIDTLDSATQLTLVDLSVALAAGEEFSLHQDDYPLPDDFDIFIGPLTYRQSSNAWHPVKIIGEGKLRQLRQQPHAVVATNCPYLAAVRCKVNDPTVGSRHEILFWPRVASDAFVDYKYRVRTDVLSSTNKYAYGASSHGDMILASIMAVAEKDETEARGVHWDEFLNRLASSIRFDTDQAPPNLGYNGDKSDDEDVWGRHYLPNLMRYNPGINVP